MPDVLCVTCRVMASGVGCHLVPPSMEQTSSTRCWTSCGCLLEGISTHAWGGIEVYTPHIAALNQEDIIEETFIASGLLSLLPQRHRPDDAMTCHLLCRSAATKDDKAKEAKTEDFGLIRVRQLDTSAVKPAPVTGIAARIGVPPPAGFGLDFLPGTHIDVKTACAGRVLSDPQSQLSCWAFCWVISVHHRQGLDCAVLRWLYCMTGDHVATASSSKSEPSCKPS